MVNSRLITKVVLFITATLFIGCGNNVTPKVEKKSHTELQFTLPEIPLAIIGNENRSQYLAEHYWNDFDFGNIELANNNTQMGIAVAGYVQVLMMNTPSVAEASVNRALDLSLTSGYDAFKQFSSRLEDYLYNPNSAMRNEELYIYVLNYTINSAQLDDIYKVRSRSQLEMMMKNRTGEIATNFKFIEIDGTVSTLYTTQSPYTVLFFNTPDCEDCSRVKNYINKSYHFKRLVNNGELTILGIYTEEDIDIWRKATYPSIMVNGSDIQTKIKQQKLYDLKALPCLYLLDHDKRVLLKDRSVEEIEEYLQNTSH